MFSYFRYLLEWLWLHSALVEIGGTFAEGWQSLTVPFSDRYQLYCYRYLADRLLSKGSDQSFEIEAMESALLS